MAVADELKAWVKDYCNDEFKDDTGIEDLPGGVDLFLTQAEDYITKQTGKSTESLGDYSVTYSTDFPPALLKLLAPYRRVKW